MRNCDPFWQARHAHLMSDDDRREDCAEICRLGGTAVPVWAGLQHEATSQPRDARARAALSRKDACEMVRELNTCTDHMHLTSIDGKCIIQQEDRILV